MPLPKSFTTVTTLSKTLALILFITLPFLGFYLGIMYQRKVSPQASNQPTIFESLFCKNWETVCDPDYTDPNGGCAPKKICVDPSPIPQQSSPTSLPIINTMPSCTPHVPIGQTGGIPPSYVYPTLSPGEHFCPDTNIKSCPMLAYKNAEGKTCSYSGPDCSLVCK